MLFLFRGSFGVVYPRTKKSVQPNLSEWEPHTEATLIIFVEKGHGYRKHTKIMKQQVQVGVECLNKSQPFTSLAQVAAFPQNSLLNKSTGFRKKTNPTNRNNSNKKILSFISIFSHKGSPLSQGAWKLGSEVISTLYISAECIAVDVDVGPVAFDGAKWVL